ncbi:uncharacterized protein LOC114330606 [Diabrotica virgifera virgifera]|uniref:Uncharacterized protein LOC114330606 n=1 Tax=Diabrotica virgifera virgifera TaxID=50390 RepID=A0A6P7FLL2_DIAVI|nr:uncharacterized protein LOC114330606 [Diabrotica virgifera virgifera]
MLIATPYRDFDVSDKSPPRVISEVRKSCGSYYFSPTNFRVKISGDLLLKFGNDRNWWPRKVSVRCGQLLVSSSCAQGPLSLRLPLRHLSLQAGPLPNSLSLCKGQTKVLTLQTADEKSFGEWVKTIAIELIRQTPLDAIKYLDILTIADCWNRREPTYEKDWNFNYTPQKSQQPPPETTCKSCEQNQKSPPPTPPKSVSSEVEEKYVEDLLKKCQDTQSYVPVKEKLFLFESLCKLRRKVRSTEDVSLKPETSTKRARSLHDLSNISSHNAVREICKYFENKTNDNPPVYVNTGRLVNSDSYLNDLYKVRKVYTT